MVLDAILAKAAPATPGAEEAVAAFVQDMQPVVKAVAAALHAGDRAALEGLRGMLPHLLADINAHPALADVLAREVGRSVLEGMRAHPAEGGQP